MTSSGKLKLRLELKLKLKLLSIPFSIVAGAVLLMPARPTLGQRASGATGPEFPYTATVTGSGVRVRGGPGEMYDEVTHVGKGDQLRVVGKRFSWAQILPPQNCRSLIRRSAVEADEDGKTATALEKTYVYADTGPDKRVFAVQVVLGEGDHVTILGERGPYYQIAPPADARLWISDRYISKGAEAAPAPTPTPDPVRNVGVVPATRPTPATPQIEIVKKEIERIKEELALEQEKPLAQQRLEPFVERFELLARRAKGDKAATLYCDAYADTLRQKIRDQQRIDELAKVKRDVEERQRAIGAGLAEILHPPPRPPGELKPIAVGRLEKSYIFTGDMLEKWYRLVDPDTRRTTAYLRIPAGNNLDVGELLGKRVGVMGERQYDAEKAVYVITAFRLGPLSADMPTSRRADDD